MSYKLLYASLSFRWYFTLNNVGKKQLNFSKAELNMLWLFLYVKITQHFIGETIE